MWKAIRIGFQSSAGDLYVADAYLGLVKVSPDGGNVTQLVGPAQGNSTMFADGLDVDPDTGIVYFTVASTNFQLK